MVQPIESVLPYGPQNILEVFERTPENIVNQGWHWYAEAQATAHEWSEEFGYSLEQVAGVIAVLSPKLSWTNNLIAARELLESGYTDWQTGTNNWKALKILEGDLTVIRGRKVHAFWRAIVNPYGDDTPVIDRHAFAVYLGRVCPDKERGVLNRKGAMERVAQAYVKAARKVNLPVHVLQATVWVQWRLENGITA